MDVRRLYKSDTDKMICGVCGGIGEFLNVDPTLVHLFSFFLEKYSQKREAYTEAFRTRMPPGRPGTYPFQNAAQAMEKALPRKRSLRPLKKTGTGRHGSAPVPIYVPAVF
mgnify:CR=1 FL=1